MGNVRNRSGLAGNSLARDASDPVLRNPHGLATITGTQKGDRKKAETPQAAEICFAR